MARTQTKTVKLFPAMGTMMALTAFDEAGSSALEEAKAFVLRLHRLFNAFDPGSEVSELNRMAGEGFVRVSEETFRLLERAVRYSSLTGGRFDVTAGASAKLFKRAIKTGRMPSAEEIETAKDLTGYRDLLLDPARRTVMLRRAGQAVDLGAIAKGYAADGVIRLMRERGAQNALINLGGTVAVLGEPRSVGVQDPFAATGTSFAKLKVQNRAVVSSGAYEQNALIRGERVHHIVDPRTGCPSKTPLAGVTLISDSAEAADALATAAFAAEPTTALRFIQTFGAQAVFVTEEGAVFLTDGIKDEFAFFPRALSR